MLARKTLSVKESAFLIGSLGGRPSHKPYEVRRGGFSEEGLQIFLLGKDGAFLLGKDGAFLLGRF